MAKYIDPKRLKEAVEKKYNSNDTVGDRWDLGYDTACEQILDIIDSLQQEQDLIIINKKDWETQEQFRKNKKFGKPLQQEQSVIQNGKFVFPKYLYARTKDNKTIDMSYVPQDITAIEYIRNDFVEQEQQEVDLEKEFVDFLEKENAYVDDNNKISYYNNGSSFDHTCDIYPIARHFYELGLNARK